LPTTYDWTTDPTDWIDVGNIYTHDAPNGYADIVTSEGPTSQRYIRNTTRFTKTGDADGNTISAELWFLMTSGGPVGYGFGSSSLIDNQKNFVGMRITYNKAIIFNAAILDDVGNEVGDSDFVQTGTLNTLYKLSFVYNPNLGTNGRLTIGLYDSGDVLIEEQSVEMSVGANFDCTCFGVYNAYAGSPTGLDTELSLDEATIPDYDYVCDVNSYPIVENNQIISAIQSIDDSYYLEGVVLRNRVMLVEKTL
jgi:hypothetical protein